MLQTTGYQEVLRLTVNQLNTLIHNIIMTIHDFQTIEAQDIINVCKLLMFQ